MNYKQIEDRLKTLKQDRSKRDIVKLEIEGLTDYINNLSNIPIDAERLEKIERLEKTKKLSREEAVKQIYAAELIEEMTFSIPEGEMVSSSGTSDKTARIALNYKDYGNVNINTLTERKRELEREYKRLDNKVKLIEIALKALTEKERFVIENTVMEKHSYKDVEIMFNQKFSRPGVYITERGIRHIKAEGMNKLIKVTSTV